MSLKPEILKPDGAANVLLVCDHASNFIPLEYDNLGLAPVDLQSHIAWDIGAAEVTRGISAILDAPALLARCSRLVIDTNRAIADPTLIVSCVDGIQIPGNINLSPRAVQKRIKEFYIPFHASAELLVKSRITQHPLFVGIHTFTPVFEKQLRNLEFAVLWNHDQRLARHLGREFKELGFKVGWNNPYSGKIFFETQNRHGAQNQLPHVTIEIRHDLVTDAVGQSRFSSLISASLQKYITKNSEKPI